MADITLTLVQGDLEPNLDVPISTLAGETVDITNAESVQLRFVTAAGEEQWVRDLEVDDADTGVTHYAWQEGDTDEPGYYRAQVVVEWPGTPVRPQTYPVVDSIWVLIVPRL